MTLIAASLLFENGKMKHSRLLQIFIVMAVGVVLATACAPRGIRIESPYETAEISIDGEPFGQTPLDIPYSRIQAKRLHVTAVAVRDPAYRQSLTFELPPVPGKIVFLTLRRPAEQPPSATFAGQDRDPVSAAADNGECPESACEDKPLFTPVLFFDTDKSDIAPQAMEALAAFGDVMKRNRFNLQIAGFADERHTIEHNLKLSLRRAQAVHDFLHARGIGAERMHVEGRGAIRTLDARGRRMDLGHNRRVEIRIVQ
jgi:outer membrane protein OmpA-like peptidoglycan-associated protein